MPCIVRKTKGPKYGRIILEEYESRFTGGIFFTTIFALMLRPRNKKTFLIILFLFTAFYQLKAQDILYMYNGDVYNGTLIHVESGRLRFDADKVGIVYIKLKDIKHIKADVYSVSIELLNRIEYYGWLDTMAAPGNSRFYNLDDTLEISIDSIWQLTSQRKKFINRFRGSVSASLNYSRSTDLITGTTGIDLMYYARDYYFANSTDISMSSTFENNFIERASSSTSALFELPESWFSISIFNYYKSVELGVQSRYSIGTGIGNFLFKSTIMNLQIALLASAQKEKDLENIESDIVIEYPLGLTYNLFLFKKHTLQLSFDNYVYTIPSQNWEFRYDQSFSIRYEIIKDLYLTLETYLNYDSSPSETASSTTDYGITTGLSIRF